MLDGSKSSIEISIHALLAESDVNEDRYGQQYWNFYPRSPCGERHIILQRIRIVNNISIHALLAESDRARKEPLKQFPTISIHALLAESDLG